MTQQLKQQPLSREKASAKIEKPLFREIGKIADKNGFDAYVVGGFVRDCFLERYSKDIDVVVVGEGIAFAELVARHFEEIYGEKPSFAVFKRFGTAQIKTDDYEIEFVGARRESYSADSRKPFVEDGTLEDDLSRRDFTINALAFSLNTGDFGELVDAFGGEEDLSRGIIRTPVDPYITFSDDPLRMMRAIRFSTQLDFSLDDRVLDSITQNQERIKIISAERINDELNKILMADVPSKGFKLLEKTGLLQIIFPEFQELKGVETIQDQSHKDNFYHTLQVLDNVATYEGGLWLRWAALLHDIGKPRTKKFDPQEGWTFHGHEVVGAKMVPKIFKRFRLPLNEKMKFVQKLVRLHLRPVSLATEEVTDSAIRRLIYEAGDDIDDLMTLCKADVTSKNPKKVRKIRRRFQDLGQQIEEVEEKDKLRNWQPPITGEIIMEVFNISPGKYVGVIKEHIKEAILNGDISNNYEEAFNLMLEKGKDLGLEPVNEENHRP